MLYLMCLQINPLVRQVLSRFLQFSIAMADLWLARWKIYRYIFNQREVKTNRTSNRSHELSTSLTQASYRRVSHSVDNWCMSFLVTNHSHYNGFAIYYKPGLQFRRSSVLCYQAILQMTLKHKSKDSLKAQKISPSQARKPKILEA